MCASSITSYVLIHKFYNFKNTLSKRINFVSFFYDIWCFFYDIMVFREFFFYDIMMWCSLYYGLCN